MVSKMSCSFVLVGVVFWPAIVWAQAPSPKPSGTGGIATGGTFQAVYDAEKRPITAGGFVKTGPIVFMNTAEQAGLTRWRPKAGTPEKRFIPQPQAPPPAPAYHHNPHLSPP